MAASPVRGLMVANSERWEGQVVADKFLLGRSLGGSQRSTVFLVASGAGIPAPTVLRLVEADSASDQLEYWQAAAKLRHPNLMQIFEAGRCQIEGTSLFYLVTEYAEENLGQIIPERPLTADEARQVLRDVLAGLTYIHRQNFVHGSLKPSHIFAVGETIKVCGDSLRPAGTLLAGELESSAYDAPEVATGTATASADVWSLGMTLAQALTQRVPTLDWQKKASLPPGIPQPFQEIIANCLETDPSRRWTVAQISARLGGAEPKTAPTASAASVPAKPAPSTPVTAGNKQSAKWAYAIPIAVAVILVILFFPRSKPAEVKPTAQPAAEQNPRDRTPADHEKGAAVSSQSERNAPGCCDGRVLERVMPVISAGAQRTIQGKIRVQIEVKVDETGKVTEAHLKSAGPSRYFAEKALEAARQWKFRPPMENGQAAGSEWRVKFMIGRRTINDSAEQIKPKPATPPRG